MSQRQFIGKLGEQAAWRWYRQHGFGLLAQNYTTRLGELDLVVQKGPLLVFAEVRTRQLGGMLTPAQSITAAKRRRLAAAAQLYLAQLGQEPQAVRFDLVEVYCQKDQVVQVHCMENALGE